MSALKTLYDDNGYTICKDAESILIVCRDTTLAGIGALVAFGVVFILGINGVVQLALAKGDDSGRHLITAGLLLGICIPLGWLGSACYRSYVRRRDAPVREVSGGLVVDLVHRVLRTSDGRELSPLQEVKVAIGVNLLNATRGLMRTLSLRWPGGGAQIMTSEDMSEIERIRRVLVEAGMA